MLRKATTLRGFRVSTRDGETGRVDRFLFDDRKWIVRWVVVAIGGFLRRRLVLLSPVRIRSIDSRQREIVVDLGREQVEKAPDVDWDKPVSRQRELEMDRTYIPYWGFPGIVGESLYPGLLVAMQEAAAPRGQDDDPHLRSSKEVIGYHVMATDGEAGRVRDFVVNDRQWRIWRIVVDAGRRILVPPRRVEAIEWDRKSVRVDLIRDMIRSLTPLGRDLSG